MDDAELEKIETFSLESEHIVVVHAAGMALLTELRVERAASRGYKRALEEIAAGDISYEPTGMDAESEFGDRSPVEGRWANRARLALVSVVSKSPQEASDV